MKLYQWQENCLRAWEEHDFRGIVNVITGAGKTVFALAAIERLQERYSDLKIRIVVPTIPLASQWKQTLLKRAKEEKEIPGFYGGMRKDRADRKIMIYIVNSARTALSRHLRAELAVGEHVLLICDECHHYYSPENRKIFDFFTPELQISRNYSSLGLSATPFSDEEDKAFLQKVLGREIFQYDFAQAACEGVISPFTVCQIAVSFRKQERMEYETLSEKIRLVSAKLYQQYPSLRDLSEREFLKRVSAMAGKDGFDPETLPAAFLLLCYQRKEISVLAESRIDCCLSLIERLPADDRILVFCERIEQAENTAGIIRRRLGTGSCGIYHSGISKEARSRNMALFREGSVRILVSCRCLDEGIDVPDANIGIVLSGSAVRRQRVQRLGRVIRRAQGKDTACLYYLYIRESADDRAFLTEISSGRCFDLQYDPGDQEFSNDLYEYAANDLLQSAGKAGYTEDQLKELRRCLLLGLTRSDYLLTGTVQRKAAENANTRKEKNYWNTMYRIGQYYREK